MRALAQLGVATTLAVLAGSTAIGSHAGRAAFPGRINGRIVFNNENNDLVLVNPDGSGIVRLADTAASDTTIGASWSRTRCRCPASTRSSRPEPACHTRNV